MLSRELRRGHITSNRQIVWVFKPDGDTQTHILESYTTEASHLLFPLFIFLQLYQVSSTETWPLLLSSVTICTPQRATGSLWSLSPPALNSAPFIQLICKAAKKKVLLPLLSLWGAECDLVSSDTTQSCDCNVYIEVLKNFPQIKLETESCFRVEEL